MLKLFGTNGGVLVGCMLIDGGAYPLISIMLLLGSCRYALRRYAGIMVA